LSRVGLVQRKLAKARVWGCKHVDLTLVLQSSKFGRVADGQMVEKLLHCNITEIRECFTASLLL